MKKIFALFMLTSISFLTLTGCSPIELPAELEDAANQQETPQEDQNQDDTTPPEDTQDNDNEQTDTPEQTPNEFSTSLGSTLVLNTLTERGTIISPQLIEGTVPSNRVFEASFPITLMTLEGDIVKERYGTANIFDENDEVIEGNVDFSTTLQFEIPTDLSDNLMKVRFEQAMMAEDEDGNPLEADMVEVMVVVVE